MIEYQIETGLRASEVAAVFAASGINRPIGDLPRIQEMLDNATVTLTARRDGRLVGVCRALTDYSYCCYLSDLAVDKSEQGHRIGRKLVDILRERIGDRCALILLSAPGAMSYYPAIGFQKAENAFLIPRVASPAPPAA